jgi:membrane associated rhomboid family serine protease
LGSSKKIPIADWEPTGIESVVSFFGLPVPIGGSGTKGVPGATLLLVILMFLGTTMAEIFGMPIFLDYGFVPARAAERFFLTSISSAFVHGGWIHFAVNAYFLLLFGNIAENRLGSFRFLGLFFVGEIGCDGLTFLTDRASELPYVGASGAIFSVLTYVLVVERTRTFGTFLFGAWVKLAPIGLLLLFVGFQIVGIATVPNELRDIGYVSHLGGAVIGLVAGLAARNQSG